MLEKIPGRGLLRRVRRALSRRPAGPPAAADEILKQFTPIDRFDPADVFIAGYPKSGNTWFQNLAAGAVYGFDPEYTPDGLIQDLVPDVHYRTLYKRYRTPMFFKTHFLPRPEYRRVVYLLRDGRDVMVSYWHHLRALLRTEIDLAKMVREGEHLHPCKWHRHVAEWTANPFGASVLTVRYEDLQNDAVRELARFCTFVGEPRETAALERVAAKSSFAVMRQKEQRFGWDNATWPKDRPFVRRGVVGSYRDEMPPEILDLFLAEAGPTLRACGYC
jgi:hypothetical protein